MKINLRRYLTILSLAMAPTFSCLFALFIFLVMSNTDQIDYPNNIDDCKTSNMLILNLADSPVTAIFTAIIHFFILQSYFSSCLHSSPFTRCLWIVLLFWWFQFVVGKWSDLWRKMPQCTQTWRILTGNWRER